MIYLCTFRDTRVIITVIRSTHQKKTTKPHTVVSKHTKPQRLAGKEKTISTDFNKINEEALENVNGGTKRIVDTGDDRNAAVRVAPGVDNKQIGSLKNGTTANATGNFMTADGRN